MISWLANYLYLQRIIFRRYFINIIFQQLQAYFYTFCNTLKLSLSQCPVKEDDKYMSHVPYASAVKNIMYAMICISPYLAHVVSMIRRFMHSLSKEH
jgi:hypothetical protein